MPRKTRQITRWEYHPNGLNTMFNFPELVMMGHDRIKEASPLTDHLHEQAYEFVYVESGSVAWEVNGRVHSSHAGQMFHTRPNEWHRARLNHMEPCCIWWMILLDPCLQTKNWLHLQGEDRERIGSSLQHLPRVTVVDARVRENFRKLRSLLDYGEPADMFKIKHLLLDIVLCILQPPAERSLPDQIVHNIGSLISKIHNAPDMRRSISQMAEELNVSESHFYRIFQEVTGQSPAAYVERARINYARQCLEHSDNSITSISLDLGFKTSQHFSTVFKRYTGFTPSEWRRIQKDTNHIE